MEGEFEELLQELRPSPALFHMVREMFKDLWEDRQELVQQEVRSMKAQLPTIERQVDKFLHRLIQTENPTAIKHYENEITKLDEQKILLNEKIKNCGRPLRSFDESYRTAMTFLANPCYLWSSDRLEEKRMVLRLVFADKLPYQRNEGYRTAQIALPFRVLEGFKGGNSEMVRPTGIEPVTS